MQINALSSVAKSHTFSRMLVRSISAYNKGHSANGIDSRFFFSNYVLYPYLSISPSVIIDIFRRGLHHLLCSSAPRCLPKLKHHQILNKINRNRTISQLRETRECYLQLSYCLRNYCGRSSSMRLKHCCVSGRYVLQLVSNISILSHANWIWIGRLEQNLRSRLA